MDRREKQLTKEIYRMIGSLKKMFSDKDKRKKLEEEVRCMSSEEQHHIKGVMNHADN